MYWSWSALVTPLTRLSLRNVPGVHVLAEGQLNTRDVLVADHVVFIQEALDTFVARTTGAAQASDAGAYEAGVPRDGEAGGRGAMNKMFNHRDILLRPVISEKSLRLADEGKYTFIVAPARTRSQIRQAVEATFNVKVTGVNTINRPGKRRRTRFGWGKRPDTKRAIVSLAAGDRIEHFGGPVS